MILRNAILLGLCAAALSCSSRPKAPWRSLVLITVDTLRADHMSCYGYGKATTPELDRFASESIRFEHCTVPIGRTTQSLASLMTGLNPYTHRVRNLLGTRLDAGFTTLAERFADAGYATAAFVEIPFFQTPRGFDAQGLDQGFGEFHMGPQFPEWRAADVTEKAIRWLDDHKDEPVFLWLHYRDPHAPYAPPEAFKNRFDPAYREPYAGPLPDYFHYFPIDPATFAPLPQGGSIDARQAAKGDLVYGTSPELTPRFVERATALYDGEIGYTDDAIGRLLRHVPADAVSVFTADHGESLGEHGLYFHHGVYVYETCLHVPLVMRVPGMAARVVPELTGTIDLAPTLLDLFGLDWPSPCQGRTLRPALEGRRLDAKNYLAESGEILDLQLDRNNPRFREHAIGSVSDLLQREVAVITDRMVKVIYDPLAPVGRTIELYRIDQDPTERMRLEADPAYAEVIRKAVPLLEGRHRLDERQSVDIDDEAREALRQNGY